MFHFLRNLKKFLPLYKAGCPFFKYKKIDLDNNFTVIKDYSIDDVVACHSNKSKILIANSSIISNSYLENIRTKSLSSYLLDDFISFLKIMNIFKFEESDVSSITVSYYVNYNGSDLIVDFLRFKICSEESDSFIDETGFIIIYDQNGCRVCFETLGYISKKSSSLFFAQLMLTQFQLFNDLDKLDILFKKSNIIKNYADFSDIMKTSFLNKNYPSWKTVGIPQTEEEADLIKMLHY